MIWAEQARYLRILRQPLKRPTREAISVRL